MRNRYLDLLRAAAIVRVIVYHLFGWPWLSIALPAMGIMFALAGSLMAGSLDKRAYDEVVASRLRRLLPPLWLLGVVVVPAMLLIGWPGLRTGHLLFWFLPLGDPPGSERTPDVWEPLWYVRAYVWFVLLSPIMYAAWRKAGWACVAVPFLAIAALDKLELTLPETADAAVWDFATYGACWLVGFAHHDGRLARLRGWLILPAAAVLGGAALWWMSTHEGHDLNEVPESQALWSLAFVLLALRWQPPMEWLARVRPLDRAVSVLNARAVTIYLWHNIAIAAVWPALTVLALDDLGRRAEEPVDLGLALVLTGVAVLAFGWAEDLAAKRRPQLWPRAVRTPEPARARHAAEAGLPVAGRRPSPAESEPARVDGWRSDEKL